MTSSPKDPVIYKFNTRVWLTVLFQKMGQFAAPRGDSRAS
jgi:hypothetical protein